MKSYATEYRSAITGPVTAPPMSAAPGQSVRLQMITTQAKPAQIPALQI